MRAGKIACLVLPLVLLGADPPDVPPPALARARAAARALGTELMGRLLAELDHGGPVEAIRVCAEVAPRIAASHSGEGLSIRRVSLRVRNPADRPDDWESARLGELAEMHARGELPEDLARVVEGPDGRMLRYLKPIVVQRPCLACHGDAAALDPAVRAAIAERYPDDRAVGYAAGDLRGAVSVTVALD